MDRLLSIDDARRLVLEHARALPGEEVPLDALHGRVLAADARAAVDLPPFASSAMDGFAVRADDTPGTLAVVDRIRAGHPSAVALAPGQAMAIATGGVVPQGADAVVPVEQSVEADGSVALSERAEPGAHVRRSGGDVCRGEVVLPAGTLVHAAQVGALAAAGLASVVCGRRPRVAVLSTGTELRSPGAALGPGEIYESNGVMLTGSLGRAGAVVEQLPSVRDDEASHRAAIERGLEADVLVTSGGVSVGPHDLVRKVEQELGVEEVFWGVAMRPGKPLAFGIRGRTLVFGLPGNPVSSLVASLLFVRPALLALQGAREPGPLYHAGRLGAAVALNARREDLARARAETTAAGIVLHPLSGQESHMIARAATADTVVRIPRGDGELPEGAAVRYLRLD